MLTSCHSVHSPSFKVLADSIPSPSPLPSISIVSIGPNTLLPFFNGMLLVLVASDSRGIGSVILVVSSFVLIVVESAVDAGMGVEREKGTEKDVNEFVKLVVIFSGDIVEALELLEVEMDGVDKIIVEVDGVEHS